MTNDCTKPRILIYDRLDSTNLEASRISEVSFRPHWILTFEQYQGIGRYGKEWYVNLTVGAGTFQPVKAENIMGIGRASCRERV